MKRELRFVVKGDPFLRRSPWQQSAYHSNLNFLVFTDDRADARPQIHELSHFFEHCSTPYGFFRDELHFRQLLLAQEVLSWFTDRIPVPVYTWVFESLKNVGLLLPGMDETDFRTFVDSHMYPWTACMHLIQVMEGFQADKVQQAVANDEALALVEYERSIAYTTEPNPARALGLIPSPDESTACPSCTWQSDTILTFPVGAEHVSEAIAQIQEGLEVAMGSTEEWKYLALPFQLIERVGAERFPSMQRHVFTTCIAIADLSLFTPIGLYYGQLRPPCATWEDIHPGHRFERALAAVAEADAWICDFAEAETLANSLCDRYGWTRPRKFLEHGASNDHAKARRHQRACSIRLSNYMALYELGMLAEPGHPIGPYFQEYMPITLHPKVGAVCNYPDGHTTPVVALEQIRDFYGAEFCRTIMLGSHPRRASIFPKSLDFSTYFANVKTEEDFANLYAEKHPWARRDRFMNFD